MRLRPAVALAFAGLAGCGGSTAAAPLAWVGTPVAYKPQNLPGDRVLLTKVRNASDAPLTLEAAKLVVRDADGKSVRSSGRYIGGYGHGLYGAFQKPDPLPPGELKRMGIVITLKPGETAPLSIAWRLPQGFTAPAHVEWGGGSLPLPTAARPGD